MTKYENIKNFILTTDANTRKNYTSGVYSFNSAPIAVASGGYAVRSYSVPLSADTRDYQLMLNMSDEDNLYRPVERYDRIVPVGVGVRGYATSATASDGIATVSVYLWSTNSSTVTFPSFTLNVIRRDFVDEF